MLTFFEDFSIHQIPKGDNSQANLLAKLASSKGAPETQIVLVGFLANPIIEENKQEKTNELLVLTQSRAIHKKWGKRIRKDQVKNPQLQ